MVISRGEVIMTQNIGPDTVVTGAELMDFYMNHWPSDDYYHDDANIAFEDDYGNWVLPSDAEVKLSDCGYLAWQGSKSVYPSGIMWPFYTFYKVYAEKRVTKLVNIEIDADKLEQLKSLIESLGGKITYTV
jgi:hypothetical protein